ncbi:MAG TPA: glycosyltransferase family 2 protein [Candidatus Polarisedimenticolia bacterium]
MSAPRGAPALSVIVPVRNEERFIRPCIDSILADAPAGGVEVIVVDGMSDDRTAEVVAAMAAADPRVRLVSNPSRFVPRAMNLGIETARAPYIGRVDGHSFVLPGYFPGCLSRLDAGGADCVGGVLIHEGETRTGRAIAAAMTSPVGVGSARFRTGRGGEAFVDTLAFGVYRREVFERIGPFDEAFVRNQDDELNLRLTRAGGRILLAPSLRLRYVVRGSYRFLARQYFQYGFWKWRVFRKHGRFASARHLAPSAFLLLLGAAALWAITSTTGRVALAGLLGVYAAVVATEALRLRLAGRAGWGRTFVALVTLHFCYGAGFLAAILDMLAGRGDSGRRASATGMSR